MFKVARGRKQIGNLSVSRARMTIREKTLVFKKCPAHHRPKEREGMWSSLHTGLYLRIPENRSKTLFFPSLSVPEPSRNLVSSGCSHL